MTFTAKNGIKVQESKLSGVIFRHEDGSTASVYPEELQALREYFDRPEPWLHAAPGEVWVITLESCAPDAALVVRSMGEAVFESGPNSVFTKTDDSRIVDARRIWPES